MQKINNPKRAIKPFTPTRGRAPITLQGVMPVVPSGMVFMPDRDYTYCRICGQLFQPALNRVSPQEYTAEVMLAAQIQRREWSQLHASKHTSTQHRQLAQSGRHCTPEALQKLVPFGIIPVSDIVFDNESMHAGLEAPRMPTDDVES